MATKLTKDELLKLVSGEVEGVSKGKVAEVLEAYHRVLVEETKKDVTVTYPHFGTYHVTHTKARTGRNPATGAEIQIPAGRKMSFKASKALKDCLKK